MDPASGLDAVRYLGITDGLVAAISAEVLEGDEVVDVSGLVVAPGFIDLHAHGQTASDMQIQVRDGVTTALDMESGVFPVGKWYASREGRSPINFGATVGHRAARYWVFHDRLEVLHVPTNPTVLSPLGALPEGANQPATEPQMEALAGAVREGLSDGGLGVGFGITYSPGATPAEIEQLFRLAAGEGAPVFVHTRAFGIEAIREALHAANSTGASLHVVHIASSSLGDLPTSLATLDSARAAGQDVTTEVYPYTAGSTLLESAMFNPGWQSQHGLDYGDLVWPLTGERLTRETFDEYRRQGGWVVIHMMTQANVDRAVTHPGVIIASDGVPFVNGTGHPRGAGAYARVLGRYVRERGLLPLMEALSKMTILPARRLETYVPAMKRKGRIEVGADADLTVFDPATVNDRATFAEPTLSSAGIPHVLVHGTFVVRDGEVLRDAMPGEPVRAGPAMVAGQR